jgi:uncharacterized protein YecT (DUF1311 family)
LLALLVIPFFIFADSEADFDVTKCYDLAQNNADLKNCATEDYIISEKKQTQVYSELSDQIKGKLSTESTDQPDPAVEILTRLTDAEKAWQTYREAQCKFEGTVMLGGTGESIVVSSCLSRITKERIKSLEESLPKPEPTE